MKIYADFGYGYDLKEFIIQGLSLYDVTLRCYEACFIAIIRPNIIEKTLCTNITTLIKR